MTVVREYDSSRDLAGVEDVERRCEVGPSGKLSLFTDLLGDPICRIRHSPSFLMLVITYSQSFLLSFTSVSSSSSSDFSFSLKRIRFSSQPLINQKKKKTIFTMEQKLFDVFLHFFFLSFLRLLIRSKD